MTDQLRDLYGLLLHRAEAVAAPVEFPTSAVTSHSQDRRITAAGAGQLGRDGSRGTPPSVSLAATALPSPYLAPVAVCTLTV